MGWDYASYPRSTKSIDIFKQLYKLPVVAYNTSRQALYAAVRDHVGRVSAVVMLIRRGNGKVGVKFLDEGSGPYYWEASTEVLDALTPTTSEQATKWRESCRTHAKLRALQVGDEVVASRTFHVSKSMNMILGSTKLRITSKTNTAFYMRTTHGVELKIPFTDLLTYVRLP